ncbi:FAD-dependent oxidoreductase [uncultured Erythrobacter sp.]|uniref:FAD-dependent oxidoreductase n=1 Tax=uncultured Erythrobacter sp. TaxID=263913 RepID=UPI00262DC050|nr:FAD-dependent oxidoreductase [uncultured Erythrobacter sp.]
MSEKQNNVMLVGGGHAHVAVLADWITNGLPCKRASLLTPYRHLRYSGMVPGWLAGQYGRDQGVVDLAALAERAGVQLLLGPCTGIDPEARWIKTGGGQVLEYDLVSFDTGGVGRAQDLLGKDPRLLDVRPIDRFVERLEQSEEAGRIAVVGGGAGGVEIAFGLRNRQGKGSQPEVTLVTGRDGLLPNLSSAVRRKVANELIRQGITLVVVDARVEGGELVTEAGSLEPFDMIIAALGSGAPDWPGAGGLATDAQGFISVDQHQRSISHPNVFATGDVAARQDRAVAYSGVHAVMAGPILAQNLRAVLSGKEPRRVYRPRRASLYLLSTSDGSAILSYGPFAAQGRWVAKLKHAIDNRWITQYASL